METTNEWYEDIEKKIDSLKEKMGTEKAKRYDLDLFTRMAKRVTEFSSQCGECNNHQKGLESALAGMGNWPDTTYKQKRGYNTFVKTMLKHLKREHHLRSKGSVFVPTMIGLAVGSIPGLMGIIDSFISFSPMDRILPWFFSLVFLVIGIPIGAIIGNAVGKSINRGKKSDSSII